MIGIRIDTNKEIFESGKTGIKKDGNIGVIFPYVIKHKQGD